jgi:hypothetical protein
LINIANLIIQSLFKFHLMWIFRIFWIRMIAEQP